MGLATAHVLDLCIPLVQNYTVTARPLTFLPTISALLALRPAIQPHLPIPPRGVRARMQEISRRLAVPRQREVNDLRQLGQR